MREEQRLMLAFVIISGMLFAYQFMFPQSFQVPVETVPEAAAPVPTETVEPKVSAEPKLVATRAVTNQTKQRLINDTVALDLRGQDITNWELRRLTTSGEKDSETVNLCSQSHTPCVRFGFTGLGAPTGVERLSDSDTSEIWATWLQDDWQLIAKLRMRSEYELQIEFEVVDEGAGTLAFQPYVVMATHVVSTTMYDFEGLRFRRAGEMESIGGEDLESTHRWQGEFDWVAWDEKYFNKAVFPVQGESTISVETDQSSDLDATQASMRISSTPQSAKSGLSEKWLIFGGPKRIELLRKTGRGFQETVDFGWSSFLARPMLKLLKVLNDFVGNWGVAIILLTILIKLVLYPLTRKSYYSMQAMSKLKPKMEALQKKFKEDPQRLNQEMMALYKQEGVNPLGGCLPMLLQIPVFFALYNVLLISFEIRQAPFGLWITDLSIPENLWIIPIAGFDLPIRLLPIVMGVTMVIQQKVTPTTVDPQQQKIMQFLPIMFTVMFYSFPSGLVLYWLTNNVVTIGQQWWIQRQLQASS